VAPLATTHQQGRTKKETKMNTQSNRDATLNLEAIEPSELSQIEGGIGPIIAAVVFGIGLGFAGGVAAGRGSAQRDAQDASETAAVLAALKQGGII